MRLWLPGRAHAGNKMDGNEGGRPHQNLAATQQKILVNNNNSYSTTFTMAKRQLYDTPQRSRVQGAHEFLAAKGIEHDECDIFEFFFVTQQSWYRMIEP